MLIIYLASLHGLTLLTAPFLLWSRKCYKMFARYFSPDILKDECSINFSSFRKVFFFDLLHYLHFIYPNLCSLSFFIFFLIQLHIFKLCFLNSKNVAKSFHLASADFQASSFQARLLCFHSGVLQPLNHL